MSGHTATPWRAEIPWRYLPNRNIVDRRGYFVASVQQGISSTNFDEMDAKGALIVTSCNSHAELVKALEKIVKLPDGQKSFGDIGLLSMSIAKAALATLTARKVG